MTWAIVEALVSIVFTAENAVSVIFATFGEAQVCSSLAIVLTPLSFSRPVFHTVLISIWLWAEFMSLSVPWAVTTGEALFIAWALTLAAPSFLIANIFTLGVTVTLISAKLVVISAAGHAVGNLLFP